MLGDIVALDGKECACTHVQAYSLRVDALGADTLQHVLREVEAGRRCGHRATETRVERLVALKVHGFGLAVKIRRNRDGAAGLENRRKGHIPFPGKLNYAGLPLSGEKPCLEIHADECRIAVTTVQTQDIILPALGIADDTAPYAASDGSENGTVFGRFDRLQAENLDMSPASPLEMHTRRNNLGIVEYHYGRSGKEIGEFAEDIFIDLTVLVVQKLRAVALRKGIFGYPVVSERIIVIFDVNVGYHREISKFATKLSNMEDIRKARGGFYREWK